MNNNYKNKIAKLWKYRISILLLFSFFVLSVIGYNSSYLIKKSIMYICIVFVILFFVLTIISLIKYLKIKGVKLKFKAHFMNAIVYLYCICSVTFIFILYGPYNAFREWLITTAMGTMTHHYLCEIFYSDDVINTILSSNSIEDTLEETDTSLMTDLDDSLNKKDKWNKYEKQLFENHTNDEIYRMIEFKVRDQRAFLIAVYDTSNLKVVTSQNIMSRGEMLVSMAKRTNALIAINGGRFYDPNHWSNGGIPNGVTIANNKIISDREYKSPYGVIGITNDNKLVLYKNKKAKEVQKLGVRDAVTSKPFLIVNGKALKTKGNGGYGYAARTAIGQRADGVSLLLVVECNDARTIGASMVDLTKIFTNYGAINAAALDGGTSSVLVKDGVMINDPINDPFVHETRKIPTGFIVTRPNLVNANNIKKLENYKIWDVFNMLKDIQDEIN